ncbi:hypothetical protein D3C81_2230780 [compost metagenome]
MKLNLLTPTSLLAACALVSTLAMAVRAEMKVDGQFVAGACNISVKNNGRADF